MYVHGLPPLRVWIGPGGVQRPTVCLRDTFEKPQGGYYEDTRLLGYDAAQSGNNLAGEHTGFSCKMAENSSEQLANCTRLHGVTSLDDE
jgi:hypothetical protein